jgi:hypothetical protein
LWATAAGRILKVGTAAVRQMLWTTRRARLFQGMLLLVIELTRAEIHGHVVRWPWQGNLSPGFTAGAFFCRAPYFTVMPM